MIELHDWIDEKLTHRAAGILEEKSFAHKWKKSTGGRLMFAGVTVDVKPSEKFNLEINSDGVEESFVLGAKNAVFSVLMGQTFVPILNLSVRLRDFQADDVGSSYLAFFCVTKEAMHEVLGINEGAVTNVRI